MSTVLEQKSLPEARARWGAWLVVAAALLVLYVPTYLDLARTLWREEEYAHGPIILAVFLYLAWRTWATRQFQDGSSRAAQVLGFGALTLGLVFYVVGRSQRLALFEVASQIPVMAGAVLLLGGTVALRRFGFALLFLAFLVPLPGFVLEAATGPLKQFVSAVVATLLGGLGYPIERSGVVLNVGGHEMLVADACSGMN